MLKRGIAKGFAKGRLTAVCQERKKKQENNMSFLAFCSFSRNVGARMKINKVVHVHSNDLIG